MGRGTYYAKICLGTVPVSEKGSAYFRAPAGIELYFQALDSTGKEVASETGPLEAFGYT